MRTLREWIHRLWGTLRPGRRDDDLQEELRLHLELVADEARRRGHDPDEAVRLARLEAGGTAQAMEAMRDQRGLPWLDDMARDVSYGLRTLRRNRGFAVTAMLSLALGIGANTGIFSLVDQLLLRRLPVSAPDRIVMFDWRGPSLPSVSMGLGNPMSYPLCLDLQAQDRYFDGVFCRAAGELNFSTGQQYEVVRSELVSGSYFRVLGIRPALGRFIDGTDDVRAGEHPVVVLSHDYWAQRLGSAADVIGRRVLVNNSPMTVIGVAPRGFRGMDVAEPVSVWIPAVMAREAMLEFGRIFDRRALWMQVFGRLKPGVTPEAAAAGLQPWFRSMLETDSRLEGFPPVSPEQRRGFLASTLDVTPAAHGWSFARVGLTRPLWALLAGTALLLLLACLNVASLLLARTAERGRELTTRMAIGASRGRITRQLVVEAVLIAFVGGLIGLAVAPVVSRLLIWFLPDGADLTPALDLRIALFAMLASVVAGVLCGIAPALQVGRRSLAASINGRTGSDAHAVRARKVVVGAQLALTLVLLAGAGLFIQTATRLYTRERGFDSSRLLMFRVDPGGTGTQAADAPRVMRTVLESVRQVPGVERAAVANNSLLSNLGPGRVLTIDADQRIVLDTPVPMMRIGPGFFSTLGVRMLAGREFDERDARDMEKTGVRTIIINDSLARKYFGDLDPVGRRLGFGNLPNTPINIEIVGVVSDFRRRSLKDDTQPEHIYVPFADAGLQAGDGTVYVRVSGEPESAVGGIRAAVGRVDARLPLINLTTLDDQVGRALRSELLLAVLSGGFGGIALLLSVVGLFGVMSFVVTQRTQEIGMRMALGATRASAIWLIVRDALTTIGGGAAVGVIVAAAASLAATPWLSGVLYGVTPSDVATFAGTTMMLTVVALAACVIPAGRAAALSPMVAIRDQPESLWLTARLKVRDAMRDLVAGSDGSAAAGTLASEVAGAIQRAASFPDAVAVALDTLRERVGTRTIVLLERSGSVFRSKDYVIPADGVLVNRLRHYPHPLPITTADIQAWGRWTLEFQPSHADEIEQLAASGVRMAVPLRTSHELVGVLLLGAPDGRDHFTNADRELLSGAADVFALLIENARLSDRALEQEKLRRDLALAGEVQRRLLPAQPPARSDAAFAAFTLPARTVGGDYYDFLELQDDRLAIAVADIAGKGIPAALLMSAVQASLRVMAAEPGLPSSRLVSQMNRFLHRSTATSSYATFFYAQLDIRGRRLHYVNAGHNPPYLVRRQGEVVEIVELSTGGTVLGLFPEADYEDGSADLLPGDLLVAFTDGVTEARDTAGEEFGEERVKALLRAAAGASAEELSAALARQIREWTAGAEQHDDITFVIAKVA